jgi:cell division protein FtsB
MKRLIGIIFIVGIGLCGQVPTTAVKEKETVESLQKQISALEEQVKALTGENKMLKGQLGAASKMTQACYQVLVEDEVRGVK